MGKKNKTTIVHRPKRPAPSDNAEGEAVSKKPKTAVPAKQAPKAASEGPNMLEGGALLISKYHAILKYIAQTKTDK